MADWVQPLELEKIFINIFAGSPDIFVAIALIAISAMASYFRTTLTTLFFLIGIFILMFSGFSTPPLIALAAIVGGLVVGYVVSRLNP